MCEKNNNKYSKNRSRASDEGSSRSSDYTQFRWQPAGHGRVGRNRKRRVRDGSSRGAKKGQKYSARRQSRVVDAWGKNNSARIARVLRDLRQRACYRRGRSGSVATAGPNL